MVSGAAPVNSSLMDYSAADEYVTVTDRFQDSREVGKAVHLIAAVSARVRVIGLLWVTVSAVVGGVALFALLQPVWFTNGLDSKVTGAIAANTNGIVDIGILSYCYQSATKHPDHFICLTYGSTPKIVFGSLPNETWKAVFIIFGAGSIGFCCTSLAALFLCVADAESIAAKVGYVQLVCTMLMGVGLTALPFGLDAPLFNEVCGSRPTRLSTGRCRIGWSYIVAILATLLGLFCPFLARHKDHTICLETIEDDSTYFVM